MNIVEKLLAHVEHRPDADVFVFLRSDGEREVTLTFGELYERSQGFAARLVSEGEPARAVLALEPGASFVVALVGCMLAGVTAVPLPAISGGRRSADRLLSLAGDAQPDVVILHDRDRDKCAPLSDRCRILSIEDCSDSDRAVSALRPARVLENPAIIQYTSGSTSRPRGVVLGHDNLAANLSSIAHQFELTEHSRVVSWLPLFHDMGLIGGVLSAIWNGYPLVLMDTRHFAKNPLLWLQSIDRFRADVSGGADFGFGLCVGALEKLDEPPAFDLSCWRLAFSGAEPVKVKTIEQFTQAMAPFGFKRSAFYPTYGLAEATLLVTGPQPGDERPLIVRDSTGIERVSCGSVTSDSRLMIVDQTGRQCREGDTGEIWVSGPSVAPGYWRGPDLAPLSFGRQMADDDGRTFLPTGDLGFIRGKQLFVSGRLKDLIIVRGRNHYPADIETSVGTVHSSIRSDACAAFESREEDGADLIVACEITRESRRSVETEDVIGAVLKEIGAAHELVPRDVVLLRPGQLPRTSSGKLQRSKCASLYESGDWTTLGSLRELQSSRSKMTGAFPVEDDQTSLQARLCQVIRQYRGVTGDVHPDSFLHAVGLDSLNRVELMLLIEETLDVTLPVDWLEEDQTIAALANRIEGMVDEENNEALVDKTEPGLPLPLTALQQQVLQSCPDSASSFLEVVFMRVPEALDVGLLQQALESTVAAHDAFRLRFTLVDGVPTQYVGEEKGELCPLQVLDASEVDQAGTTKLRDDMLAALPTRINVEHGPLAAATLVDRGQQGGSLLVLAFSHLVVDGVSLTLLQNEFNQAFACLVSGQALRMRPVTQFPNWLAALDDYRTGLERQREFWHALADQAVPSGLTPASLDWQNADKTQLGKALSERLLAQHHRSAMRYSLFIAALSWAWRSAFGESKLLCQLENNGRVDLDGVNPAASVGWFVCRYPMLFNLDHQDETGHLAGVRQDYDLIPDDGLGYGLLNLGRALLQPTAFVEYRGMLDDTRRPGSRFPVIGVTHLGRALQEAQTDHEARMVIGLSTRLRGGQLEYQVHYRAPVSAMQAASISASVQDFILALDSQAKEKQ